MKTLSGTGASRKGGAGRTAPRTAAAGDPGRRCHARDHRRARRALAALPPATGAWRGHTGIAHCGRCRPRCRLRRGHARGRRATGRRGMRAPSVFLNLSHARPAAGPQPPRTARRAPDGDPQTRPVGARAFGGSSGTERSPRWRPGGGVLQRPRKARTPPRRERAGRMSRPLISAHRAPPQGRGRFAQLAATARRVITCTRCARYSGVPCRSPIMPSAATDRPSTASGE